MGHHAQHQNIVWLPAVNGIAQSGKRTVGARAGDILRRGALWALRAPWLACRGFATWYRCRQAFRDLRQADPRLLRDIGLDRADLWQAVRHGRIDRRNAPGNWHIGP